MRMTTHKFIRLHATLRAQCELSAAKAQMSFGKWAREAFELKLKQDAKGLKRK